MKVLSKGTLALSALVVGTILGIAGSTAGTLAWYAYSQSVTTSFVGASIYKSTILSVGLVDDAIKISDEDAERFKLKVEDCDEHRVLWTSSQNSIPNEAILKFLSTSGYASAKLSPVTTQARSIDAEGELDLFAAPNFGEETISVPAKPSQYVYLPLAFKIAGSNNRSVPYQNIWLTDATVKASGENIDKSVRVYVENDIESFLINPSDTDLNESGVGYTNVGGMLDIDDDGTYDYSAQSGKEFVYGQYSGTLSHSSTRYGVPYETAEFDNVNNTPYTDRASSFYAKHNKDAYTANINDLTPLKAEYYQIKKIYPQVKANGDYYEGTTGKPIANTNSSDFVGYANFTVFIEGWDYSVINQAVGYYFNLGLTFEVNKI